MALISQLCRVPLNKFKYVDVMMTRILDIFSDLQVKIGSKYESSGLENVYLHVSYNGRPVCGALL